MRGVLELVCLRLSFHRLQKQALLTIRNMKPLVSFLLSNKDGVCRRYQHAIKMLTRLAMLLIFKSFLNLQSAGNNLLTQIKEWPKGTPLFVFQNNNIFCYSEQGEES